MLYQFYIELNDSDPLVWRRILVPYEYTFFKLHMAIQAAFGWENAHLYQFSEKDLTDEICYGEIYPDGDEYEKVTRDARKTKIHKIFRKPGTQFSYVYDFGDYWVHTIRLEKIVDEELHSPLIMEGEGACPPEDVGGLPGYQEMLRILNTRGEPDKDSYVKWLGLKKGEKWNAGFCSTREVNKRMALLREL